MSAEIHLIIDTESGLIVNAIVGSAPAPEGFETVAREGAAEAAWIGWTRLEDGSFEAPAEPEIA